MSEFSPQLFASTLALIGSVIVIAALLSGAIDRTGFPQVAVFLALGATVGPHGLGLVDAGVDSPMLQVVATLSLVLVLFTDAVSLNLNEVRKHALLSALVLGPGTTLSAVLIAAAACWLLGLAPAMGAILGAALASTDPVLLRGLLKLPTVPPAVRQALQLESGLNDLILLPIVLVSMTLAAGSQGHAPDLARMAVQLFLLGPAAGVVVGFVGVSALEQIRRKLGVRRDYESLYSLGLALAAFAAGESVHGSGFLAAFAAGLTISFLDVELCDCFMEYGETTAEMALLFTFLLFGTSIIWSGLGVGPTIALPFAGLVFVLRIAAFFPSLLPIRIPLGQRWLISWFGPRGLSSLLLVMVPVFAKVPGAKGLIPIACLVVLISVVLHGLTPMFCRASGPFEGSAAKPEPGSKDLLAMDEYVRLRQAGEPHRVVDVRTQRSYEESDADAEGAVRLNPEHPVAEAERLGLPKEMLLALYCT